MKNKFNGFDTETLRGYCIIAATQEKSWFVNSFESAFAPCFTDVKKGRINRTFFAYNLDYDLRAILKYLTEDELTMVMANTESYVRNYKILYIPSKIFKITDINRKITLTFFDIAQFTAYMGLDSFASEYLGEHKQSSYIISQITKYAQTHSDLELSGIFMYNLEEIKSYCIQDAKLAMNIALYINDNIKSITGFEMRNFTSIGGIAQKVTLKYNTDDTDEFVHYPRFFENSKPGMYAKESFRGGIFNVNKLGTSGLCTAVDISSAYPDVMVHLPNWSNGNFVKIESEQDLKKGDYYGWVMSEFDCECIPYLTDQSYSWYEELTLSDGTQLPSQKQTVKNKAILYPKGKRTQYITLIEYRFMKEYGYKCKIIDGYVWRNNPDNKQYKNPFGWINDLYRQKQEIKNDKNKGEKSYEYLLVKKIIASAYGKTCQEVGAKRLTNHFYSSYITASCRVKVWRFIKDNNLEDKLLLIATDGILIEGHHNFNTFTTGKKDVLGSWDVDLYDRATIISNGVYQLDKYRADGSCYHKVKVANRGFPIAKDVNLRNIIKSGRHESSVNSINKMKPLTVKRCLIYKKLSIDDINVFTKITRKLHCGSDKTKIWPEIKTFDDLLTKLHVGETYNMVDVINKCNKITSQEVMDYYIPYDVDRCYKPTMLKRMLNKVMVNIENDSDWEDLIDYSLTLEENLDNLKSVYGFEYYL